MGADEALDLVRGYAAANRIRLTRHARARMEERCATHEDVKQALMSATGCQPEPDEHWLVTGGRDRDETPLALVVVIEDGIIVVTLF
jgi:hypothetical protein